MTELASVEEPGADDTAPAFFFKFKGEKFGGSADVSEWAVLEFAEAVDAGLDGGSYAGMAALMRFVIELVAPEDRDRFRATARLHRATAEDLFALLRSDVEDATD